MTPAHDHIMPAAKPAVRDGRNVSSNVRVRRSPTCQDRAMVDHENPNTTEARAGATPHVARHVLVTSQPLIIAAFATLMIVYR